MLEPVVKRYGWHRSRVKFTIYLSPSFLICVLLQHFIVYVGEKPTFTPSTLTSNRLLWCICTLNCISECLFFFFFFATSFSIFWPNGLLNDKLCQWRHYLILYNLLRHFKEPLVKSRTIELFHEVVEFLVVKAFKAWRIVNLKVVKTFETGLI